MSEPKGGVTVRGVESTTRRVCGDDASSACVLGVECVCGDDASSACVLGVESTTRRGWCRVDDDA